VHISASGRFVIFSSSASNLVAGDLNQHEDVFLLDRDVHGNGVFDEPGDTRMEIISVASDGTQADQGCAAADVTPDGRLVVFTSTASNLSTPGSHNGYRNVYVRDRFLHTTERMTVAANGGDANGDSNTGNSAICADGSFVVFASAASNLVTNDFNALDDVFVRDRFSHRTAALSTNTAGFAGNGSSAAPTISDSGQYVSFSSRASDLVVDDNNGAPDIFVRDLFGGGLKRASLSAGGTEPMHDTEITVGRDISGDGCFVVFDSSASDLVANDSNASADVFIAPNPFRVVH